MIGTATALLGGSLLGGLAGAFGKNSSGSATSGVNLAAPSALQTQTAQGTGDLYSQLQGLVGAGPGASDVSNAAASSQSLAALLNGYSQSGGLPNQQDISSANGVASNLYAPQQTALQQQFTQAGFQEQRTAAQLGRDPSDPVLQAKLQTNYANNQAMLQSQQGSTAQQLALALPGQRVNYATQANGVLNGLASQAFSNRSALLATGNQILGQQQQYQLGASGAYGSQSQSSGGGLGGAINGALSGAGAFASALPSINNIFKPAAPTGFGPTAPGGSSGYGALGSYSGVA